MKVLDLTDKAFKVNSFYNNNIKIFDKKKKKIQEEIENYDNKLSEINKNIEYKKEGIQKIKDNPDNHYCNNLEYCLLIEKEKEVDALMKEIEDFENKKNVYEKGYKEIENLLYSQDQQYSNNIIKFQNERNEIIQSIVNQAYYSGVLVKVAEEQIIREKTIVNDQTVKPFINSQ